VATLEPIVRPVSDVDAALWRLVSEGKASWSGGKPEFAEPRIRMKGKGPTLSEMIIEDRG